MNLFKSVFSEDPDPITKRSASDSDREEDEEDEHDSDQDSSPNVQESNPNPNSSIGGGGGGWSFGGLIKTLSTKSESVLETYRRDLKEFGSGLKKETETFREVASRAVKELPTSIEAGKSKAQGSLETVWKGTTQIISHGKDALLTIDQEIDSSVNQNYSSNPSFNSKQYSRFDARIRKIQSDLSTYRDEPEDLGDYSKWKLGFLLEEKGEELERLFEENEAMEEIYKRIVPNEIDRDTFWYRYFYMVYKVKQAEDARAKLVKRAISEGDEEELSWDVDDDEEEEEEEDDGDKDNVSSKGKVLEKREVAGEDFGRVVKEENSVEESRVGDSGIDEKGENADEKTNVSTKIKEELGEKDFSRNVKEEKLGEESGARRIKDDEEKEEKENRSSADEESKKSIVVDSSSVDANVSDEKTQVEGTSKAMNNVEFVGKSKDDGKVALEEGKEHLDESSKNSASTVAAPSKSTTMPEEEEDLGWDEIEDLGSGDEKKVARSVSPNRADLRKRLSAADEDEDLSWDIEDDDDGDDEPIKA